MSFALQATASLHTTANLPVPSAARLSSAVSRQAPASPTLVSVEQSEFQQGLRNARIQTLANGEHSVLCYDAATDYNELFIRQSRQAAIEAAQAWVKHKL